MKLREEEDSIESSEQGVLSVSSFSKVSRRKFLAIFAGLSAGVFATGKVADREKEQSQADVREQASYVRTIAEQGIAQLLKSATAAVCEAMNIEYGNKTEPPEKTLRKFRQNPVKEVIEDCILAPVLEEALFRHWPSSAIDKNADNVKKSKWGVGIPLSVLFAYAHNITIDSKKKKFGFQKNSLPVTQFIGSLFYWYFMRKRGLSHAILAHGINNATYVTSIVTAAEPEKSKQSPG